MKRFTNKLARIICIAVLASLLGTGILGAQEMPELVEKDGRWALMVDGAPFLMLGGQSGNSSTWPAMMPGVWATIEGMGANTLEIPIYWEQVEPEPGRFDFSSIQMLLDGARQHDKRLVILWFATWKNGSNHYMPEWMKKDPKKYPNVTARDGRAIDSPSPHCEAAMKADARAFAEVMKYLRDADPQHTVVMVQVQNEPGSWNSVRDFSSEAERLFRRPVPEALLNEKTLGELGVAVDSRGTWAEVFGERADEYFHAWSVASYIEYVAAAGKAVNPLPMMVNAALRDPLTNPPATHYESGGPTDNVIPVWKVAAPSIDLLSPDIYLSGHAAVLKVLELYARPDNALMVPEASASNSLYLYEVIKNGIGFAPFGVDRAGYMPEDFDTQLCRDYKLLAPLARELARWSFEGKIHSAVEPEDHSDTTIDLGGWEARLTFGPPRRGTPPEGAARPVTGKAMIVKLGDDEFLVTGTDVRFTFAPKGKNEGRPWQYLKVKEGRYENGEFRMTRVLNGDETDWGGPHIGNRPSLLHITLTPR